MKSDNTTPETNSAERLIAFVPPKYRRFAMYVMVGLMNTAVDFIVFTLLFTFVTDNKLIAQSAGYAAGLLNSFILNRSFTFGKASTTSFKVQVIRFLFVNAIAYAVSLIVIELLSTGLGINVYIAKILTSGAVMAVNYLLYKVFVFVVKDKE